MLRRDLDGIFTPRRVSKRIPFAFVLDELAELAPWTRLMFGCHAVYVEDKIVFVLRDKGDPRSDDGVWIATTKEHHEPLRADFPSMRSISVLAGGGITGWQVLPADAQDFEEGVLRACELVRRGDPRIGKVPAKRKSRSTKRVAVARRSARHAAGTRFVHVERTEPDCVSVHDVRSVRVGDAGRWRKQ